MIGVLLAAVIGLPSPGGPAPLSAAEKFDLSCAESAGWVLARDTSADGQANEFATAAFYLGRLSGRDPNVDWKERVHTDARTLPDDQHWHVQVLVGCFPLMRSAFAEPN
jgi:hypothetical protein